MGLQEDKKSLIKLITWYRDEWHKKDFGHTEMIEEIKKITESTQLNMYEQVVDGWLD